jgi:UPF0716 family protein affecting phage T7 exclusion
MLPPSKGTVRDPGQICDWGGTLRDEAAAAGPGEGAAAFGAGAVTFVAGAVTFVAGAVTFVAGTVTFIAGTVTFWPPAMTTIRLQRRARNDALAAIFIA